jgi:hypothetical protein
MSERRSYTLAELEEMRGDVSTLLERPIFGGYYYSDRYEADRAEELRARLKLYTDSGVDPAELKAAALAHKKQTQQEQEEYYKYEQEQIRRDRERREAKAKELYGAKWRVRFGRWLARQFYFATTTQHPRG